MKKLKAVLFLMFILSTCCQVFSQDQQRRRIDELLTSLKTSEADIGQLNTLNQLGHAYLMYGLDKNAASMDTALLFFNKALGLSKHFHLDTTASYRESLCGLGQTYLAKNNFEQAKAVFMQVVDHYGNTGDKIMEGRTLVRYGEAVKNTVWITNNMDFVHKTEEIYERAVTLFISIRDNEDEITAYAGLATLHLQYYIKDQGEADCLHMIKKYHGKYDAQMVRIYYILSTLERYHGNYEKALRYSLENLTIADRIKDKSALTNARSLVYGELGLIYDALDQTENSILWYKKTLEVRENMPMKLRQKYRTAGFMIKGLIKE